MSRTTYVLRDGVLVEKHHAPPLSGFAPNVISDAMAPIRSHADGRIYDSKSAYRQGLRATGCVEVGNDKAPFDSRPDFNPGRAAHDIKRALEQLGAR